MFISICRSLFVSRFVPYNWILPLSSQRIFTENKDGIIFIDEFHQLASSEERIQALKLMVPYLTNPDFARTVVIGAGYKHPTLQMLAGRFTSPCMFHRRISF